MFRLVFLAIFSIAWTGSALAQRTEINFTAPTPEQNAFFGVSTAIVGDLLFVGAMGTNNFQGSVFVFRVTDTNVTFLQRIDNPDAEEGSFGLSFAAGQVNDGVVLAVGASGNSHARVRRGGPINGGEVFVFLDADGGGDNFLQTGRIDLGADASSNGLFGAGVSLNVVGNPGSQSVELVVGAPGFSNGTNNSGAVGVFTSSDMIAWNREQLIALNTAAFGGNFGRRVILDGDRLLISAMGEAVNGFNCGAVHLYQRDTGLGGVSTFSPHRRFVPSDPETYVNAFLGDNIAFVDGFAAARADDFGPTGGEIFIFGLDGAPGDATESQIIQDPNPRAGLGFGRGLAGEPGKLFIGACGAEVDGVANAGKVDVYINNGGTFVLEDTITRNMPIENDYFGEGLSSLQELFPESNALLGMAPSGSPGGVEFAGSGTVFQEPNVAPIFTDGFESGDTSAWTKFAPLTDTRGGGMTVNRIARFTGNFGLGIIPDGNDQFVQSGSPDSEVAYNARFHIRRNDTSVDASLFSAYSQDGTDIKWLDVQIESASNTVTLVAREDDGRLSETTSLALGRGWSSLEVAYRVGSPGSASLTIDGSTVTLDNLDNDTANIDGIRLGVFDGATPRGGSGSAFYFDDFSSNQGASIGADCLELSEIRGHAGDWSADKNLLELVPLVDLGCL